MVFGAAQKTQDLALFSRHMAGAMRARAPLAEVVGSFAEEADTRGMQRAIRLIVPRLEAGAHLSVALDEAPGVFPLAYRRIIRMGEEGQNLPGVMEDMADALEQSVSLHESFRRAAVYPTIILFILFLASLFTYQALYPKLYDIFSQLGGQVPGMTSASFGAMTLPLISVTLLFICLLWTLGAAAGLYWNTYHYGRWLLSLPLIGPALRLAETSRFVRHLGLLLENRVPLNEAVGLLAESTINGYVRAALLDFQQRLERGESLGVVIAGQPLFPPALSVMLGSAQERGHLAETLNHLAAFYRERANNALRILREFFEPFMLIMVGLMVAWLALSLYLPIFQIPGTVNYVLN